MTQATVTEAAQAVLVSRDEMLRYHDPERIQSYCQSCEKHGMFWSCPPFEEQPLEQLAPWTHAVLVTQKTWIKTGSTNEELMQQFEDARLILGDLLIAKEQGGAVAVVAGHCFGCTACTRPKGLPCSSPNAMHYSLEALGFDVSGIAEGLAGQTMHWPESGIPDYLITVGALLCANPELATRIEATVHKGYSVC